jgi:hypothetical protein
MHKICNTPLLQFECSEWQAVGGNADRYIDAVSGIYKGKYMAGYSQDLGVTAVLTTTITVGVMEVIFFLSKNLILIVVLHKFTSQIGLGQPSHVRTLLHRLPLTIVQCFHDLNQT